MNRINQWSAIARAWVARQIRQISTWLGVVLNVLNLNWASIQQQVPAVVQQMAQTHPGAANAISMGVSVIGLWLIVWNAKKGKADGNAA